MATLAELTALRDALQSARYSGQRRVKTGSVELEFKTDGEMKAALADLDREISAASSSTPIRVIRINSCKGF